MTALRATAIAALALGACAKSNTPPAAGSTTAVDHSFRTKQPEPGPETTLAAPVPARFVLDNGLTVLAYEKAGLPLAHLEILLGSGSASDPHSLPGLAGFTAEMLKTGTKTRSAEQIADEIETLGASLHIGLDQDSTSISVTSLTENIEPIFDVVADILLNANFIGEEIERTRKRRLGRLAQLSDSPPSLASRIYQQVVYGEHPYGHGVLGEGNAIRSIRKADLETWYRSHLRPDNAVVIIVGSLTVPQAHAAVSARLGAWMKPDHAAMAHRGLQTPAAMDPVVVLVDKAGAPQSQLRIGHVGLPRSHPDYFPLLIANSILGGSFNSRINMNLREDKGYTYGARSHFDFSRGPGPFTIQTGVRTDVTKAAIDEVLAELAKFRTGDITDEELRDAKARYSLSLPGYFQRASGIGSMLANIHLFDLPLDYYQKVPEHVAAVTLADIQRVATEHLRPDELSIVVVGDGEQIASELAALGRGDVQRRTTEGGVQAASPTTKD